MCDEIGVRVSGVRAGCAQPEHGPRREPRGRCGARLCEAAAGLAPPRRALRYLTSLRRPDGSFRYSARYAVTPVWVTAQVLASAKALPLRTS